MMNQSFAHLRRTAAWAPHCCSRREDIFPGWRDGCRRQLCEPGIEQGCPCDPAPRRRARGARRGRATAEAAVDRRQRGADRAASTTAICRRPTTRSASPKRPWSRQACRRTRHFGRTHCRCRPRSKSRAGSSPACWRSRRCRRAPRSRRTASARRNCARRGDAAHRGRSAARFLSRSRRRARWPATSSRRRRPGRRHRSLRSALARAAP